jgi:hypothetical protein
MNAGGVQRSAQVVEKPGQLPWQRAPGQVFPGAGHHVRRADFTAWMPYFASLL